MTLMRSLAACVLLTAVVACDDSSPARPPPRYPYPYAPYPGPPPPNAGRAPTAPTGPSLSAQQISPTVNAAYPSFTACYQKSESYMTGKSGSVTIFFDVAQPGNVVRATDQAPPGASVPGNALRDPQLVACLSSTFMGLRFPAAGDTTSASWTFSFSP